VISVLVASSSLVARAGLKALLEQTPEFVVAGIAGSKDLVERALMLQPDVILWQLSLDEDAIPTLHALDAQPAVLITSHAALDLIRAGARGVLPLDASEDRIAAAIRAAAADLVVLTPEAVASRASSHTTSLLTARETEVLQMIAEGLANKEIAWRLGISEHTVKFHVSALLGKLGVTSRAEAIGAGIRHGAIML
jgi:DNA-binding NarL/FixJ family response regulator